MLSPSQESCPSSRARFWCTREGIRTFEAMVQHLAPNEVVDRARSHKELLLALRASDFVSPEEVDDRVHGAARVLAERLRAETRRIARHRQFVQQPQPFRADVVYGVAETRTRDSMPTNAAPDPQHGFFQQYMAEQSALARRGSGAAKWQER